MEPRADVWQQPLSFAGVDQADGDAGMDEDEIADGRIWNKFETNTPAQAVEFDEPRRERGFNLRCIVRRCGRERRDTWVVLRCCRRQPAHGHGELPDGQAPIVGGKCGLGTWTFLPSCSRAGARSTRKMPVLEAAAAQDDMLAWRDSAMNKPTSTPARYESELQQTPTATPAEISSTRLRIRGRQSPRSHRARQGRAND